MTTNPIQRATAFALLFTLTTTGCAGFQLPEAAKQFQRPIPTSAIEFASSARCEIPVTDDAETNVELGKSMIDDWGISVVEGPLPKGKNAVAFRGVLKVRDGFWDEPAKWQAEFLLHEVVHYCQREQLGDDAFDTTYLTDSAMRWAIEVQAYSQSYLTVSAQGVPAWRIERAMDKRINGMVADSLLFDLNEEQFRTETKRIWLEALARGEGSS